MTRYIKKNIISTNSYIPGRNEITKNNNLEYRHPPIRLASNANILGPSPKVIDALKNNIGNIKHYPDSSAFEFKEAVALKYDICTNNILVGNGSAEIIDIINRAMLHEKDEILIGNPTFPKYEISAQICNASVKKIEMVSGKHNLKGFLDAVNPKTKLLFVDTPCNPVGSSLNKHEILDFIERLPENILAVFDEAYHEFNDPENHVNYSVLLERKNVLFMRTLSKAYGIAGLRIGYLIGNHETVSYINKVREVFNVNSLALCGGTAALKDEEHLIKNTVLTHQQIRYLYSMLDDIGYQYYKSHGNFIMIETKRDISSVDNFLLEHGIIVRPILQARRESGLIRVTVGKPEENKIFIDTLRKLKEVVPQNI